MGKYGALISPSGVCGELGLTKNDEIGAWSKLLDFLKSSRKGVGVLIPSVFISPKSNRVVAVSDRTTYLAMVEGEPRFVFEDDVGMLSLTQEHIYDGSPGAKSFWGRTLIAFAKGHLKERSSLVEESNTGLTARRGSASKNDSRDRVPSSEDGRGHGSVRPRHDRRRRGRHAIPT